MPILNPKENALRIIGFSDPQYMMMWPPCHTIAYFGCNHEGWDGSGHHLPVGSKWRDIWDTGWHREHDGVMGFPREYPLADLPSALSTYLPPDPDDPRVCGTLREQQEGYDPANTFLCGSHRDTLWEKSYMLAGMQNMMMYFYTEPDAVRQVLRMIMDFQLGIARHYIDLGVEMVAVGDDLGSQTGPLFSPEILRGFLVPEYRRLFDFYKSRGVLVSFHCCGAVGEIVDTLMELGVDVLNPVQQTANDLPALREKTMGRLALAGGVSSAIVMDGPESCISNAVLNTMHLLGEQGGYFCAPDQYMPYPKGHMKVLQEVVESDKGKYPLNPHQGEQKGNP